MNTVFEWDEQKNKSNRRKHGVDFIDAARVFDDVKRLIEFDRVGADGDERFHALGLEPAGAILLVVHIYKGVSENEEEIIRIISARAARPGEIRRYFQQAAD
jgi:uncharacterized protein